MTRRGLNVLAWFYGSSFHQYPPRKLPSRITAPTPIFVDATGRPLPAGTEMAALVEGEVAWVRVVDARTADVLRKVGP